ncbi:L-rhamnose 1-dehydrogenase (NADP(+)) [uncultured archaeon]|nr:L-rhamnose 1-dehydrogenase (NADP(+)) [uncultured archaeon]
MSEEGIARTSGRFSGKVAVVTGGGSGLGQQIAKDLCLEGAIVHILGRNRERLERSGREIEHETWPKKEGYGGQRIFCHQCDVSDLGRVQEVFRLIHEECGNVACLVNNAAVNPSRNDILHTDSKDWIQTLMVNLGGAFNCSQAAARQMLEAGSGSIVNIASVGGLNPFRTRTSYNSSKFGLIGLTESMALDYADKNIRVNAVCPGYMRTDFTIPLFEKMGQEKFEELVNAHAMRRLGRPEEIARAVLFLLSEEASFITGIAMPVDGGYLLKG